jgi:hypothetical protein
MHRIVWIASTLLVCCGCQAATPSRDASTETSGAAPSASAPSSDATDPLTDRVWVRADSTGMPGVMRAFLSDGTLIIDSCWETYRLSRWSRAGDAVTWNEDGRDITATITRLDDRELVLSVALVSGTDVQRYAPAQVPFVCPDIPR